MIDCPPSLSLLTLNALTASDRLIIPVQAQFLAMRGMAKLMQVVHKVQQRLNSDLSIAGVLITLSLIHIGPYRWLSNRRKAITTRKS